MDRLFVLLQQEGYLFRSCLTTGLTVLRKADLNDPGAYYTAFFQLSTGLERLLKAIIVIEHLVMHDVAPTEKELRRYGHDLLELLAVATRPETPASLRVREALAPDTLNHVLWAFLGNFARTSRYFNLNMLAGTVSDPDPIDEWNRIVVRLLAEDEHPEKIEPLQVPTALRGSPLRIARLFKLRRAQELASSRAVVRLVRILATLRERLGEVMTQAYLKSGNGPASQVPHMIEFLNFTYRTDGENRRKKRWP